MLTNEAKASRERLTLIRIFEELRGRGYDGSYDAVRRYAKRWVRIAAMQRPRREFALVWPRPDDLPPRHYVPVPARKPGALRNGLKENGRPSIPEIVKKVER